jgi:hypothetical protein
MSTKIQQNLWNLANYDSFIMQYCPTIYNKVAGVGSFFLFQILIVFSSVYIAYNVFVSSLLIFGFLISLIATFIFYKWMKYMNDIHHKSKKKVTFIIQFFINQILAFALSIPFCLSLFDHQILFQLYLKTGKMSLGSIEQFWLKPYGLYQSWLVGYEGTVILSICIAISIMVAIIFLTPYILILNNKKSSYPLIKKHYERNF